ncbi:zinc finger, C4 type [Ancylostoma duodenale]|uniref:Zinc finger, C4 type n=1 Tax=Ancylostoma duodenale TaxID=51022 RepID=A0A0C2D4Q5_9BILA|nr:zinc finger, C4 type [Ancylostoma duodenale]
MSVDNALNETTIQRETLAFVKHEFFYQAPPEELFYPQPECMDWPTRSPSPCRQCTICGAPSNGYHFNAPSCSACAAFFRRTVTLGRQFVCAQYGCCKVHFGVFVKVYPDITAVQPRRDCNVGRRKISYSKRSSSMSKQASLDKLASAMEHHVASPLGDLVGRHTQVRIVQRKRSKYEINL